MPRTVLILLAAAALLGGVTMMSGAARADNFKAADLTRWHSEYMSTVKKGRALFTDPNLGTNGVVCGQCHPNAANTHPETFPKFQQQIGQVVPLWMMINWCIRNPLEGKELAADDPRMLALQAYITQERRGVKLTPGKH